jgi:hypothetical protein
LNYICSYGDVVHINRNRILNWKPSAPNVTPHAVTQRYKLHLHSSIINYCFSTSKIPYSETGVVNKLFCANFNL